MALTVNTNISSLNTQRNLSSSSNALGTSLQRLSTGHVPPQRALGFLDRQTRVTFADRAP